MAKKISLLIVDDEESVRDSLNNWFIEDGYNVACASDAKEALSKLEARNYDIILADIKMPGMDGMEATQKLRQQGFDRPIIALTANAMRESRSKCLAAGCDDFISKPIDRKKLVEKLAFWIGKSRGGESTGSPETGP